MDHSHLNAFIKMNTNWNKIEYFNENKKNPKLNSLGQNDPEQSFNWYCQKVIFHINFVFQNKWPEWYFSKTETNKSKVI